MKSYKVRKYDLNGRWDPYYNHTKFEEIYNTLTKCPFPLSTLKKESSIIFSGTTPLSGGDAYTSQDGIPFIRSGDFSENNMIDFSDVLYLKEEIHNGKMKSSQLKKGDMLIAIVGATIGKVGIYSYDREANINQAICAVRLKELDPYYAQAFFQTNIGQMLIEHIKRPVARANINLEEIGSLFIPKADLEMQQKVVSLIQIATQKKQQKEQQAKALLQSIDGYLLNELGIQIPETKSQTIQDRMFVVNFSDASGERLDPMFYAADTKKYTHCTYSESIESLTLSCNSGFAVGRQDQIDQANGILQIRPTNIDNNGQLKYDKNVYVPENNGIQFVPSGVVLFNNTNSQEWVGKTAYFSNEENRNVYISNHITAINVDNSKIMPMYLSEILNMYQRHKVFYSICTNWNNQSGIGLDLLSILHIPLFTDDRQRSLAKQQEIVDHISSIRQQAKALQEEGKAILEQAKKEVEQMILGN